MIVYVSDSINSKKNGGSSTSGFEFLKFLQIHYKEVILITSDRINKSTLNNNFYGYDAHEIKKVCVLRRKVEIIDRSWRSIIRPIYYYLKDLGKSNDLNLTPFVSEKTENLIFVNSWSAIYMSKSLKGIENFKKICIVRGSPESFIYQSFENDKNEAINKAANYLENFDNLIFVSKNGLEAWRKRLKNKIPSFYLPNSINEQEIERVNRLSHSELVKKIHFENTRFNIVVVGSIQKRKAQEIFVSIIENLLEVNPSILIHFVGGISKTWGGEEITRNIMQSKFSENFIFHGHSDNPLEYVKAADLTIFTSYAEAFPRTVAEYMALGKPIIAANVSGVNEMIIDGKNGLLFDPHNPQSLVRAFKEFNKNETKSLSMANNAYNTYWTVFSKDKHIKKAIDIFNKISIE